MKYASYLVKHIIEDANLDIEDKKRLAYEILNQALETGELNLNQIEHNEGFTHLIAAVDFDDAITVEWLLDHDQNINVATRNGITALHEAARDGRAEIMQILLERGANPNARILSSIGDTRVTGGKYEEGDTPINLAVRHGHFDMFKILFDHHIKQVGYIDKYLRDALNLAETILIVALIEFTIPLDLVKSLQEILSYSDSCLENIVDYLENIIKNKSISLQEDRHGILLEEFKRMALRILGRSYMVEKREAVCLQRPFGYMGLTVVKLPGDGHCLFNAVALHVGMDAQELRNMVANEIEKNIEEYREIVAALNPNRTVAEYLADLRNNNEWADNFEIQILAKVLNRPIDVHGDTGIVVHRIDAVNNVTFTGPRIPVHYNGHNHYNALITQDRDLTRNITPREQFDEAAAYNLVRSVISNINDNVVLKKLMHYFGIRNLVQLSPILLLNPHLDPDTLHKLAREVNTTDLLTLIVNHPNDRDNQPILLAVLNNPNITAYLTDQIQANHVIARTDPQILAAIDRNSGRTNTERAIIIEEVFNNPTSDLYNVIPMDLQRVVLSFSFAGNNPSAQNDAAVLAFYQGIHQQREQYRIQQAAAIAQSSHAEATNKRDRNEDESDSEHDNHDNKPSEKRRRTRSPSPK